MNDAINLRMQMAEIDRAFIAAEPCGCISYVTQDTENPDWEIVNAILDRGGWWLLTNIQGVLNRSDRVYRVCEKCSTDNPGGVR